MAAGERKGPVKASIATRPFASVPIPGSPLPTESEPDSAEARVGEAGFALVRDADRDAEERGMADESEARRRAGLPIPGSGAGGQRSFKSADILGGDREVVIEHDGERYRLRLTGKGKLILTK